jgi:hypothetical protein
MKFKCKRCGSTEVECEYEAGKDFFTSGAGANTGFSNLKFTESPFPIYQCDHMLSGNACCPCGWYLNPSVKSVCVMVGGQQTWPTPYGEKGLTLDDAWIEYRNREGASTLIDDRPEADILKTMWDRQMITGEVYITRLREIGDKKREGCERLK